MGADRNSLRVLIPIVANGTAGPTGFIVADLRCTTPASVRVAGLEVQPAYGLDGSGANETANGPSQGSRLVEVAGLGLTVRGVYLDQVAR